jgi:hypothetical protein
MYRSLTHFTTAEGIGTGEFGVVGEFGSVLVAMFLLGNAAYFLLGELDSTLVSLICCGTCLYCRNRFCCHWLLG